MLVLTRKQDETILIGGGIEITVLKLSNGRVRLGITAPRNITVHREEVAEIRSQFDENPEQPLSSRSEDTLLPATSSSSTSLISLS